MYITFSACQFKQVWCLDVESNDVFYPEKQKSAKASGALPLSQRYAHSAPPDPLAGFKPILCLVVFFEYRLGLWISLSPHF